MIRFTYFDVGGVVIKDFTANNKWQELEKELGVAKDNSEAFVNFWDEHEDELCSGYDAEVFFALAKEKFNLKVPGNYSILEGFAKRFEVNRFILPAIDKAREKGKIGLLTNMYPGLLDIIFNKGLIPDVEWDAVVDSSVVKVAKPDFKIFEIAEERAGVKKEEILFVENSKMHVDGAKAFGWQAYLYDSADFEKSTGELLRLIG